MLVLRYHHRRSTSLGEKKYKICGIYKVPAFLVGVAESDIKYNNFSALATQFYRDGVEPIARAIAQALSMAFETKVSVDLEQLIAGDLATAMSIGTEGYNGGGYTRDEYRKLIGKPPATEDDVFKAETSVTRRPDEGLDPLNRRGSGSGDEDESDDGNLATQPDE